MREGEMPMPISAVLTKLSPTCANPASIWATMEHFRNVMLLMSVLSSALKALCSIAWFSVVPSGAVITSMIAILLTMAVAICFAMFWAGSNFSVVCVFVFVCVWHFRRKGLQMASLAAGVVA